jgi:hypothetical protein
MFFQTLRREPWGARDFILRDPDGNLLLFAGPADIRDALCRRLAQAIPAQAILTLIDRHRQPRGFLGAPARPRETAGEFRSAAGTGEAARGRIC